MLIVKIKGGVGNQLFQYAFGRQLAINNRTTLNLDNSFFENVKQHRSYNLGKFNLIYKNAPTKDVSKYRKANHPLINKFLNSITLNFSVYVERKVKGFDQRWLQKKNGYFEGYWQSEQYFKEIRANLLEEITLKEISGRVKELATKIENCNAISIHIRKTDYLNAANQNIYADCSINYYKSAIDEMLAQVEKPVFYLFSDDFEWVEKNLAIQQPHVFMIDNSAEEDLYLMSICKHHIIANSTFSWWGAWLNKSLTKKIIAPKYWFKKNSLTNQDIIPENWLKINN